MELGQGADLSGQPTGSQKPCNRERKRSGLLAFLRPRQTVSPGPHHASHDQRAACRSKDLLLEPPQTLSNGTNNANSDWSNLPDHLIESIMHILQSCESDPLHPLHPLHPSNKPARLSLFAATSVSKNWQHIGKRAFFQNLWDVPGCIRHPVQLFGLSPGTPNHLMKCVMKREYDNNRSGAVKYTLRLGDKFYNSDFLMAALQTSRLDIKIHLSSDCKGTPCARIQTNLLGTKYDVILDKTVQPFIQYEQTHSHASGCSSPPLAPLGPLMTPLAGNTTSALDSAGDILSSQYHSWYDVPMLDSMSQQPIATDLLDTNASLELNPAYAEPALQTQETIHEEMQVASPRTPRQSYDTGGILSSRSSRRRRREALHPQDGQDRQASSNAGFLQRFKSGIEETTLSIMDSMNFSGAFNDDMPRPPCSCETVPSNIGGVQYKTRVRGFMRPRRMKVALPDPSALACFDTTGLHRCCSTSGTLPSQAGATSFVGQDFRQPTLTTGLEEGSSHLVSAPSTPSQLSSRSPVRLLSRSHSLWRSASSPVHTESSFSSKRAPQSPSVVLRNKPPHWNDTLRCWCLNFRGRVKLASVKNFQLVKANDPAKSIVMQFGKVDTYTYIMDYNPSEITALQAFAISLSTFETKLLL